MPADEIGTATFMHNGPTGSISIRTDANLVKESSQELVPETGIAAIKP